MLTLIKGEDAPITVAQIKAALGIETDALDKVIMSGIAAHTVSLRRLTWERADGSRYVTEATPRELAWARLAICRWCENQADIWPHITIHSPSMEHINIGQKAEKVEAAQ